MMIRQQQQLNAMFTLEKFRSIPTKAFLKSHPKRRSIADRLHKLMDDEHLSEDIFQLTMTIFDRFINQTQTTINNDRSLQLIAFSCYNLAKKLRESSLINNENEQISWIIDKENYSDTDVFESEQIIVETLDWDLSCYLPHDYAEIFLELVRNNVERAKIRLHVQILLSLTISELNTLTILPNLLAGGCLKAAMKGLRIKVLPSFDDRLTEMMNCKLSDLNQTQTFVEQLFQNYVKEILPSTATQRRCLAPIETSPQQQQRTKVK